MPEARIEIEAEDGCIDALAAWPEAPGRRPPVILLGERTGLAEAERAGRRLAARGYFVLVPNWTARPSEERRADAEAWLDWLADERRVEDSRVGVAGWGAGADLALKAAAWRSERIAAAAAFHGRGFGSVFALELAQRINALVHLGYRAGRAPGRGMATLEAAFCAAGVDFEVETYGDDEGERERGRLLELFDRTLATPQGAASAVSPASSA